VSLLVTTDGAGCIGAKFMLNCLAQIDETPVIAWPLGGALSRHAKLVGYEATAPSMATTAFFQQDNSSRRRSQAS
jgi:hypothetical protein